MKVLTTTSLWVGLLVLNLFALTLLAGCAGPTLTEYIAERQRADAGLDGDPLTTEATTAIPSTSTPVSTPTFSTSTPVAALPATRFTREANNSRSRPTSNPQVLGAAVAKINIPSLALRRFPLEDAPPVGGVREGEEYGVGALSRDGKWVRLETPLSVGGRGWVAARFVSVTGEITGILITDGLELGYATTSLESNQAMADTGTRRLRLRSGPGASFDTVFFAFNGEIFTVVEESDDGLWVHLVDADKGIDGWAARQFMRLASDPVPTPRPSPTSTPTVLLKPPTPSSFVVTPTSAAAGVASTNRATSGEITDTGTITRTNTLTNTITSTIEVSGTPIPDVELLSEDIFEQPKLGDRVVVVTDGGRLRVRSRPTVDSDIVGYVFNAQEYLVVEISIDGEWGLIIGDGTDDADAIDGANNGWVSLQFLRSIE